MTIGLRPRWRPTHMKLNRTRLYWSNSSERMSCATHCRCPLDLPNNYVRWLATRSRRLVMIGWKLVAWCVSFTHTVPTPRFDVSKMRHPILWLTGWMKLPSNSSNGPMVNILMPPWPIQFSLFFVHLCVLPSWKNGIRGVFHGSGHQRLTRRPTMYSQ